LERVDLVLEVHDLVLQVHRWLVMHRR